MPRVLFPKDSIKKNIAFLKNLLFLSYTENLIAANADFDCRK